MIKQIWLFMLFGACSLNMNAMVNKEAPTITNNTQRNVQLIIKSLENRSYQETKVLQPGESYIPTLAVGSFPAVIIDPLNGTFLKIWMLDNNGKIIAHKALQHGTPLEFRSDYTNSDGSLQATKWTLEY